MPVVIISSLVVVLAPMFWAIIFGANRKKSLAYMSVFILSADVLLIAISNFVNTLGFLEASIVIRAIYPLTTGATGLLYILFVYYFISINQKMPRRFYILFIIPAVQFLLSGYAFYMHVPMDTLKPHVYDIIFKQPDNLPANLMFTYNIDRITSIIFFFNLTGAVISSLFFIPVIIRNAAQEFAEVRERVIMRFLILLSFLILITIGTIMALNSGHDYENKETFIGINLFWASCFFMSGWVINKELIFINTRTELPTYLIVKNSPLAEQLERYFTEKKPYLSHNLKISDVAVAMGTNRTYISDVINNEFKSSFNEYVNRFRVNNVLTLLKENGRDLKAQQIAYESGFNSYATFFRAFKEIKGTSFKEFNTTLKS